MIFGIMGMGRMAGEGAISVEGIFLRRLSGWFAVGRWVGMHLGGGIFCGGRNRSRTET